MILIKFSQVNVYLPEQRQPLLRNLNFNIKAGEWVSLVGTNGSGKSVLGKLIAGLDIRYKGDFGLSDQVTSCQYIMQNPDAQLIGETVWEDICFGLEAHGISTEQIKEQASLSLKRVGLSGFETRPTHSLSGGQKQLLAIAGAIALKPSIIIADEVTSMLDPASREGLLRVLLELNKEGVTIIAITQLLEELAYSSRVMALNNGGIEYLGPKESFFYSGMAGKDSVCEAMGLELPYTVQVVKRLLSRGVQLQGHPILPEELLEAVAN